MKMTNKIVIRLISKNDFKFIEDLLHYWFLTYQKEKYGITYEEEYKEYITMIESSLGSRKSRFFIASINGKQMGIFGYSPVIDELQHLITTKKTVQFRTFFVHPDHRGQGIGKTLVNFLVKYVRDKGVQEGFMLSHERFEETSWYFHDSRENFFHIGTYRKHNQSCRVYKITM